MSDGVFSLNDYLRISPDAAGEPDSVFAVADLPVLVVDPVEHASYPFAINDYLVMDGTGSQSAVFGIADTPLNYLPPVIKSSNPFAINDYLVMDGTGSGQSVMLHAVSDYPLISPPLEPSTQEAVFGIADYNIITDPSPEKLKVWDSDLQRWVHAPRYIWHSDPGEWRQLS